MGNYGIYDGLLGPNDVRRLGPRTDYGNLPANLFPNHSDCR